MPRRRSSAEAPAPEQARHYTYPDSEVVMRPDVGVQGTFRKKKAPATYRYDSSLAPELEWDSNPAREQGEALIRQILDAKDIGTAQEAARRLAAMSRPFLNWAGKAERLSFDVPTLPLFVHERLSTRAVLESVRRHRSNAQMDAFELFGDPKHDFADQVLRSYEHRENWVNRMILGDSLVVMNSLLKYEGMGGQVQMIYIDPPYGVKFGSNFQPFVRKRDVTHNDDADMTREPEMVQAYRDTWELGLHSYLTYLRDRLLLARDLLSPSGSVFVQISDENVNLVRDLLDDVFGRENAVTTIVFQKTSSEDTNALSNTADYLLWYARRKSEMKYHPLYVPKLPGAPGAKQYVYVRSDKTGEVRKMTAAEIAAPATIPDGWRVVRRGYPLTSQHYSETRTVPFVFEGKTFRPGANRQWSVDPKASLPRLVQMNRIYSTGKSLSGIMYLDDMPGTELSNVWTDTGTGSFTNDQLYVVQTSEKVIARCLLMTTDPGDLVLDPTCGSGTTAYVAEAWGRRWVTIDTSRVPLILARERMLTSTFRYYKLRDEARGPAAGFYFLPEGESTNKRADGFGIARQQTLSSIAGEESATDITYRQSPEVDYGVTRVTGPFCVEATIPAPVDFDGDGVEDSGNGESYASFVDRMIEVLRRSPSIQLSGNRNVTLARVRPPARTLSLSAEAMVDEQPVAIVFGPENGAVSDKLVIEASREAYMKGYTHLYVIGFAIQPGARELIDSGAGGIPATYVNMTPDVMMGDLLKNMRSSQIFSVCGQPEIEFQPTAVKEGEAPQWTVKLLGLDVFDPATMEVYHKRGDDVPCWMLDTDYDGLCFRATQVFFPRTAAWDNLKRALKADYDASVWDHLAGDTSAPFPAPAGKSEFKVAVKVIDERGNELLAIRALSSAI